ncbi:MAG TPA: hypothetical protein VMB50_08260 [Myxococcales bacterium]|nr:hypothetical protein [Myxococcales bacterium]
MKIAILALAVASLPVAAAAQEPHPQVRIFSDDPMTLLLRLGEPSGVETTQNFNEAHASPGTGSAQATTVTKQYREWEPVCGVPCGRRLSLDFPYRIGGDGIVSSGTFMLPLEDNVEIHVRTGSSTWRGLGWAAIGLGIPLVLAGLSAFVVAPANGHSPSDQQFWNTAGGVTFGVGVVLEALGISGVVLNRTTVDLR